MAGRESETVMEKETGRRPLKLRVEGFPSGQREQTVNLPAVRLRRFKSYPLHHLKKRILPHKVDGRFFEVEENNGKSGTPFSGVKNQPLKRV